MVHTARVQLPLLVRIDFDGPLQEQHRHFLGGARANRVDGVLGLGFLQLRQFLLAALLQRLRARLIFGRPIATRRSSPCARRRLDTVLGRCNPTRPSRLFGLPPSAPTAGNFLPLTAAVLSSRVRVRARNEASV